MELVSREEAQKLIDRYIEKHDTEYAPLFTAFHFDFDLLPTYESRPKGEWRGIYERGRMTIEFICEQLAEMFDVPCQFSPEDEIMGKTEYCDKNCGNGKRSECWKEYFRLVADMKEEE